MTDAMLVVMPHTNPTSLLASFALLFTACSFHELVEAPPVNPTIQNSSGEALQASGVICEGPEDELALLGSLCEFDAAYETYWRGTDAAGEGMATSLGIDGDPMLIITAEIARSTDTLANVAAEAEYAAFVVLETAPDSDVVSQLEQWRDGEAVDGGSVTTETLRFEACTGSTWVASGVFTWRNTTITVSWNAAQPC